MSTNDTIAQKASKGIIKFLVALLMFIILVAISLFVMGVAVFEFLDSNIDTPVALTLGVILSVLYAIVVYIIPYLRKISSVRWFAFCALGDAAWWIYLLVTN